MRIIICHNTYQLPGGEDVVAGAEATLLREAGHEVVRWTAHNSSIGEGPIAAARTAAEAVWSARSYKQMLEHIASFRPHVAHFHNTFPLLSPSVYAACQARGVPVVQTLHNYRLVCPQATLTRDGHVCQDCVGKLVPLPGVVHACYRGSRAQSGVVASMLTAHRLLGTYRHRVDTYIALTEFMRGTFVAGGLPAERIVVKPNFVGRDPGAGGHEGGYVLYAGRLDPSKGVSTLLAAWERLQRPIPLKIVGSGDLQPAVEEAARTLPGVEYLGPKPHAELLDLMGDAALVVVPSEVMEAHSLVSLEAFAKGTPVLASRIGSLPFVVAEGRTGWLFEPGDAAALADAVENIFGDPAEVGRRGALARAEYEAKYTAERNLAMLEGIYDETMARASARRAA